MGSKYECNNDCERDGGAWGLEECEECGEYFCGETCGSPWENDAGETIQVCGQCVCNSNVSQGYTNAGKYQ